MKAIKSILGIALFLGVFTASAQTPEGVKQEDKAQPKKSMSNKPRHIPKDDRNPNTTNTAPEKKEAIQGDAKKEEKKGEKAKGKKARKEKVKKGEAKAESKEKLSN